MAGRDYPRQPLLPGGGMLQHWVTRRLQDFEQLLGTSPEGTPNPIKTKKSNPVHMLSLQITHLPGQKGHSDYGVQRTITAQD